MSSGGGGRWFGQGGLVVLWWLARLAWGCAVATWALGWARAAVMTL